MLAESIQAITGFLIALIVPGFLLVLIFFDELAFLERMISAITFSIIIDVGIAIFLGYDKAQAVRTGGITLQNIMLAELIIIGSLLLLLAAKLILRRKTKVFIKKGSTVTK